MFEVAVTYLVREGAAGPEVLLGRKLTGIGAGLVVGPGGKLEPGEDPATAAAREVREEVGVAVATAALTRIAELDYTFPHRPEWSQRSTAFLAREWAGDPVPSRELIPSWFPLAALPLDQMWEDARLWLPRALSGGHVRADCCYGLDNQTVISWAEHDRRRG